MDAIADVKVLQNNYQAEYGGSAGSSINAVTKSSTNAFHGAAYYYNRNEALQRQHVPQQQIRLAETINRFNTIGYNAGGPVIIPGPGNLVNKDMQKLLNLLPLPNFDMAASHYKFNYQLPLSEKNPVNQRILRLDYNISSKWRAYFRGLDMRVKSQGPGATALSMIWLTSFPVDYINRSPNVSADVTYIATPILVNELNVGWAGWSEVRTTSPTRRISPIRARTCRTCS